MLRIVPSVLGHDSHVKSVACFRVCRAGSSSSGHALSFVRCVCAPDYHHGILPFCLLRKWQGATMMDGGSLLKPALSRGELRCIGERSCGELKRVSRGVC